MAPGRDCGGAGRGSERRVYRVAGVVVTCVTAVLRGRSAISLPLLCASTALLLSRRLDVNGASLFCYGRVTVFLTRVLLFCFVKDMLLSW